MDLQTILVTTLLAVIGYLISHYAKRIDKTIELLSVSMKVLAKDIELSHKRQDIMDVILSTLIKDSFSSKGIAEDRVEWPRVITREDGEDLPPRKPKKRDL